MDQKHRDNLKKLADYLMQLPIDYEHFDMVAFAYEKDSENYPYCRDDVLPVCGTVCCAVGHGPAAGIPAGDAFNFSGGWDAYCYEKLGIRSLSKEFEWMFGCGWYETDNTPQGAASRIYWYLENAVPEDYWAQRDGRNPLCYLVQGANHANQNQ